MQNREISPERHLFTNKCSPLRAQGVLKHTVLLTEVYLTKPSDSNNSSVLLYLLALRGTSVEQSVCASFGTTITHTLAQP